MGSRLGDPRWAEVLGGGYDVDECEDLDTLLDDLLTEYESTDKMQAQVDAQEIYYACHGWGTSDGKLIALLWTKPPAAAPIPTVTATAAHPPATFPVICPHGAGPGSHLRVRAPNTGQEMTVIVPAGVGATRRPDTTHIRHRRDISKTQVPAASSSCRSRRRRRRAGRSIPTWLPATAVERVTLGRLKKSNYTGGLIGEATKKLHHLRLPLGLDVLGVQ